MRATGAIQVLFQSNPTLVPIHSGGGTDDVAI